MSDTKKRIRLSGRDRIVAWLLLVMVVLTVLLAILSAAGLRLMAGETYLFLPMMVLLLLIGWGVSALWRRMKPGVARKVVGGLLILAMSALALLGLSFASIAAGMNVPRQFAVMTNEGHRLVVLRALDGDEARLEARRAARLEADPDSGENYVAEDWGYTYTAYKPVLMGLFYDFNSLLEGDVHIGYASKAELMVEWEDDVGHFFIKNPEVGDEGEMRARG